MTMAVVRALCDLEEDCYARTSKAFDKLSVAPDVDLTSLRQAFWDENVRYFKGISVSIDSRLPNGTAEFWHKGELLGSGVMPK